MSSSMKQSVSKESSKAKMLNQQISNLLARIKSDQKALTDGDYKKKVVWVQARMKKKIAR